MLHVCLPCTGELLATPGMEWEPSAGELLSRAACMKCQQWDLAM